MLRVMHDVKIRIKPSITAYLFTGLDASGKTTFALVIVHHQPMHLCTVCI